MSQLDHWIRDVFADDADAIGEQTLFAQSAGWDSLKHVELIVAFESRFAVELTPEEVVRLTSRHAAREILAARQIDV